MAGLVLVLTGIWLVAGGGWIYAKAALAQTLLTRAWTETLAGGGAVRPWPWADTWPIARLRFPAAGRETIVLAGAQGASLAFGPGHVDGTPPPGAPGNSVIGGHRDTSFTMLGALHGGDTLSLQTADGRWRSFSVIGNTIVDARKEWHPPQPPEGLAMLTLVTCWPLDAIVPGGPLRYLVFAEEMLAR
jgi:sortase A